MKDTLTCIVIDDDDLDRMAVEAELSVIPRMKILGSFNNSIAAIEAIHNHKPYVLFLDIDMPGINGIDFAKSIVDLDIINVFITSHPEYALQGFQLKVFDFILNPLETDRFESCLKRIFEFEQLKGRQRLMMYFLITIKSFLKRGIMWLT